MLQGILRYVRYCPTYKDSKEPPMRKNIKVMLSLILFSTIELGAIAQNTDRFHEPSLTGGQITINTTSPLRDVTRMQFTNPEISRENVVVGNEQFTDFWIPGESQTTESGKPALPKVNRLIGIPDRGAVKLRILASDYTEETGIRVYPFQTLDEEDDASSPFLCNRDFYAQNTWYPPDIVTLGEPAVLRDVRLTTVSICPVQVNPATGTVRIYHNIDIQVEPTSGIGINEKTRTFVHPTGLLISQYRQLENFQYLELDEQPQPPGTYLIICGDDSTVVGMAERLADWKRRKGIPTRIATLAETGRTATEIKNYVQNAYNTWDPPLEFLCLLGDHFDPANPFHVPAYSTSGIFNDDTYGRVAGNDILTDIAVGRLSAMDAGSMNYIITKSIRYEQNPYTGVDWFTKAYLIAGTSHGAYSNIVTMEHVRQQMYNEGFSEVVLHTTPGQINAPLFRQQINLGRTFFFHRPGWTGEIGGGDLTGLANGWMLPFAYTITCGSGPFAGTTGFGELFLRYGSTADGGGCIGCIGSTTSGTHTRYNNLLAAGISDNFTVNDVQEAGLSLMEGKYQLFRNYFPTEINSYYCLNFNLMGDPGVKIWTAFPESLLVSHPAAISLGTNRIPVLVHDIQGNPAEGALVCVMNPNGTEWNTDFINDSGYLELSAIPETEGTWWLTVSKKNCLTYTANISVVQQPVSVTFTDADVDDDNTGGTHGNGDGVLNPGETVDLTVTVHNFGSSQSAANVVGDLSSFENSLVQVLVSQQSFPNITPGSEVTSQGAFRVSLTSNVQDQQMTPLRLRIQYDQGVDTSLVALPVVSGRAELQNSRFLLSNNRLDPGETEQMEVTILNVGHREMTEIHGRLFCLDSLISIPQFNGNFGSIPVNSAGNNQSSPFQVTADSLTLPGHSVTFGLALSGSDGYVDTVYIPVRVGSQRPGDPSGPDQYGYYCFDNTDTSYSYVLPAGAALNYQWIEIDSTQGGSGHTLAIFDNAENRDDNDVIALPFVFYMYGMVYDSITVCSNGWAALGSQRYANDFTNYIIPGPEGPDAMLAAFWDDLIVGNGHVYWDYLEADGLFIVEWSGMQTLYNNSPETFQLVLYDPTTHLTVSGDGLIKFQYQEVHNVTGFSTDNDFATVGIESHTQRDGLQITYWNNYASGAAPLENGRAYLFVSIEAGEVGPDSTGPSINHTPLTDTVEPGPYQVTASIWDISGVENAWLHYSTNGISFTNDPMTNSAGSDWEGLIPGQIPGTIIRYFISAADTVDNIAQTDTFAFDIWQVVMQEDVEHGASGWTHYAAQGAWNDQWHISEEDSYSGTHSWKCGDSGEGNYADLMDAYLESPDLELPSTANLRFYHRIQSESSSSQPDSAYDGGLLEISFSSGAWEQLFPEEGGYNRAIRSTAGGGNPYTGPFACGTQVWADTIQWSRVTVDLSGHQGPCRLRFRFGSDAIVNFEGWYIDDIMIIGFPESGFIPNGDVTIPRIYSLGQNYPNPFNPMTSIPYTLRETSLVNLTVYNVLGQKVATLVDEYQEASSHRAVLDATSFASGIYFYRLQAGQFNAVRKMVLLK